MLISARDLVLRAPTPDEQDIRIAMSGNLCRCTGYVGIIRAIQSVIADRRRRGIAAVTGAGRAVLGPAGSGHGAFEGAPVGVVAASAETPPSLTPSFEARSDWQPQTSLSQHFIVNHPVADVWNFFADTAAVAACLPGASVAGDGRASDVSGKMRVKVGPIAAEFHGAAQIDRDPQTRSGTIRGSGSDQRSNSVTRGIIHYRLVPQGENATKVELNVGYRLTGPLAQFGRPGLVNDIASRLVTAFAKNVEARLSGAEGIEGANELNAGALIFSALATAIKTWFRSLFGRPHG
jgi:aerobic carbon-monoxide dehydrogenase small subunit